MAINNTEKKNGGNFNNAHSDGLNQAKDGKGNAGECYELDPEKLASIAGGAGKYDPYEYDTYRHWGSRGK